jgi:hypothetical protein
MATEDERVTEPLTDPPAASATPTSATAAEPATGVVVAREQQPTWWHRDHPTFSSLTGFFTGLAFVIVVPGIYVAILSWIFEDRTAEDLFPFVVVSLAVPVALAIVPRTRRFGLYMLIGIVTTAIVVGGVTAVVLWYMVTFKG